MKYSEFKVEFEKCEWSRESDDVWRSDCGLLWEFDNEETPKANNMNYCPQCGKILEEAPECWEEAGGSGMSNITVGTQEYNVWLACEKGWKKAAGNIITINGIDFSFVIHGMFNPKLLISGLTSGAKVVDVELFILEVINCDTKEKTLQMMHEYAVKLSEAIPDNFNERIQGLEKSALLSYVSEFGDMPEITPFVDKRLEGEQ